MLHSKDDYLTERGNSKVAELTMQVGLMQDYINQLEKDRERLDKIRYVVSCYSSIEIGRTLVKGEIKILFRIYNKFGGSTQSIGSDIGKILDSLNIEE